MVDVAKPSDFDLPYQDLELKTSDGVTLRCYLLPQSKLLPSLEAATVPDNTITEDEVESTLLSYRCAEGLPSFSSLQVGRQ